MLRHLKNVEIKFVGNKTKSTNWRFYGPDGWDYKKRQGHLLIVQGKRAVCSDEVWSASRIETALKRSKDSPQKITQIGSLDYWVFEEKWYSSGRDLQADEVKALLKASQVRVKQSIDRAKSLASAKTAPLEAKRGQIPSDLRLLIWAKYEGSCADCGSSSELQFDHIIPVVMGGATSEENLQILCGSCNRSKGASLG